MFITIIVTCLAAAVTVNAGNSKACPGFCLTSGIVRGGRYPGDKVTFECDPVHTLVGANESTCLPTGEWTNKKPVCLYDLTCPYIVGISGGQVDRIEGDDHNKIGGHVKFSCHDGFEMIGATELTCLELGGQWSHPQPYCRNGMCNAFTYLGNGIITKHDVKKGGHVTFQCNSGFRLIGEETLTCGDNRTWSGNKPTCQAVSSCPSIYSFDSGSVSTTDTNDGTRVIFTCNPGYELDGTDSITCLGTQWSASVPTCKYARCRWIPLWWYGKVIRSLDEYGVSKTIDIKCDEGFKASSNTRLNCVDNYWTKPFPRCRPHTCKSIYYWYRGTIENYSKTVGSTWSVKCDYGYKLASSVSTSTCQEDRTWSEYPRCIRDMSVRIAPYECMDIVDLYNGKCVGGKKEGDVRQCNCNQGYKLVGASSLTCVNQRWDQALPKCQDTRCPYLSAVYGGKTEGDDNFPGANVTYSCHDGYELHGTQTLTCLDGKTWSDKPPICIRSSCASIVKIRFGSFTQSGSTLKFTCDKGFTLVGSSESTCTDRQWTPAIPRCNPNTCAPMQYMDNGVFIGTDNEVGSSMSIVCNPGFTLSGPSEITCQENKAWSGQPRCQRITCPIVYGVSLGKVLNYNNIPGSTVTFECDSYYELDGVKQVTCQADGQWSDDIPTCKAKQQCPLVCWDGRLDYTGKYVDDILSFACEADTTLIGATQADCQANGTWSASPPTCQEPEKEQGRTDRKIYRACPRYVLSNGIARSGRVQGDKATFECDPGFTLVGPTESKCVEYGEWSPNERPVCHYNFKCHYILDIHAGYVERVGGDSHNEVGGRVKFSCIEGFDLVGVAEAICMPGGNWSDLRPACAKKTCGAFSYLQNGQITQHDVKQGGQVTFECNPGFNLVGEKTLTCKDKEWSGQIPTCKKNTCPLIYSFEHGVASIPAYTENSTATFTCKAGYELNGAASITCEGTKWSADVPTCKYGSCKWIPIWWFGKIIRGESESGVMKTIDIQCNNHYKASAPTTLKCVNNYWTKPFPACKANTCRAIYAWYRGTIKNYSRTVGSTWSVQCDPGFKLASSVSTSTCQENRQWTAYPRCVRDMSAGYAAGECVDIVDLYNGKCVGGKQQGDVRECSCDPGYELSGAKTLTCMNQRWSHRLPRCAAKHCPFLPAFIYGSTSGDENFPGSTITYTCNEGFYMIGAKTLTCMSNRKWSSKPPYCRRTKCSSLVSIAYGKYSGSGYLHGDILGVTCDKGYKLSGSSTIKCYGGNWTPSIPKCARNSCKGRQYMNYGTIEGTDYTVGSKLKIKCDPGFTLSGPAEITCQPDFTWSAWPRCGFASCPSIGGMARGKALNYDTKPGTTVTFQCDDLFELHGEKHVTCQQDGQWSHDIPTCKPKTKCPTLYFDGTIDYTGKYVGDRVTFGCDLKGSILVGASSAICQEEGTWSEDLPKCFSPWAQNPCLGMLMDILFIADISKSIKDHELQMERDIIRELIDHFDIAPDKTKVGLISYGTKAVIEFGLNDYSSKNELKSMDLLSRTKIKAGGYLHNPLPMVVEEFGKDKRTNTPQLAVIIGDGRSSCPADTKCAANALHDAGIPVIVIGVGFDATRQELNYLATGDSESNVFVVDYQSEVASLMNHVSKHVCSAGPQKASYVTCPRLCLPNGQVFGRRTWLHTATFECDKGYELIGQKSITCQTDGTWSAEMPVCQPSGATAPTQCPTLCDKGGYFDYTGKDVGNNIYHICDKGYHVDIATPMGRCQSDGTWTTQQNKCVSLKEGACKGKEMDVYFLVDISNSVNGKNLARIRAFVMNYLEEYDYSSTRAGVIAFSDSAYVDLPLSTYESHNRTFIQRQTTQIGRRLDLALELLLKDGTFPDSSRERTAIVVLSRPSTMPTETLAAAKKVHDAGINVHVLGITDRVSDSEMTAVATGNTAKIIKHKSLTISANTGEFMDKTC